MLPSPPILLPFTSKLTSDKAGSKLDPTEYSGGSFLMHGRHVNRLRKIALIFS